MNRRLSWTGTVLTSLLLAAAAVAQPGGQTEPPAKPTETKLTPDQLATAAKLYFRDTAELPLLQSMEFSIFDTAGRPRKTQKLTVDYLFRGYNPRSETGRVNLRGNVSFWAVMRRNKMFKASMNSAAWTLLAGVLARGNLSSVPLEITPTKDEDGSVLARLGPKASCQPFTMKDHENAERYFPDGVCSGAAEFRLDRNLRFQDFTYEAPGLPIMTRIDPFGACELRRYHSEIEFQIVTIPGDNEPFLLPKRVTTTLETNKGNVAISSTYEPKPLRDSSVH